MKQCHFCMNNKDFDYKDIETLKKFVTTQARVTPKRQSNVCAKHQRRLAESIKRARFLALLPFVSR